MAVIEKALELGGYAEDKHFTGINGGSKVVTGFGHNAVLGVADKVVEAVKSGAIKHFFIVGGCDGAKAGRNYYTEFVKQTPHDSVVLTLACGKYRFNDLDLGIIKVGGKWLILHFFLPCNLLKLLFHIALVLYVRLGGEYNASF